MLTRIVSALVLALVCSACTCEDGTVSALRSHGFTNIETTGWSPLACSGEDTFSTGFRATNSQGQTVTGTVCCGWVKNCTVRF